MHQSPNVCVTYGAHQLDHHKRFAEVALAIAEAHTAPVSSLVESVF